ncbi:MAG TPA: QueT transporter family protein [Candidatus Korarchaeota archaeon]|nr:QueT transporter family protein [Candidatus Korarchaeota archaeon]
MRNMSLSQKVAALAVIAAAYASLTLLLAPISFYAVQVRVADALLALSVSMGPPAIFGTALGCFIANMLGPFGIMDALGGSIANLVATVIAWKLRSRPYVALAQLPVTVSLIVSAYLHQILNLPFLETFVYILIGSVISIDVIGLALLRAYQRLYGA